MKKTWGVAVLAIAIAASYLPAMRGGYIWDDDAYVTANRTLTQPDGLRRIWLEPGATPQYYPLVFTSFWIERRLWGLDPAGYHIVNVALHIVNALLLWVLLARVGFSPAWLAAAVFALHPVQVESVAWITERKNVLSGCFYLLAALAYAPIIDSGATTGGPIRTRWRGLAPAWAAAFLCFAMALLSKSVTATLPGALLVLAWWRRGTLGRWEVVALTPFVALGAASGLLTSWLEKYRVGARGPDWLFSLDERFVIAGKSLWFSLGKTLWPYPLSFVYPRWAPHGYPWWHLAAPLAVPVLILLLWRNRTRIGRGPLAALLFFIGTLAPALGFVDFYPMRYSFVADHFWYLAIIGPILFALGALAAGARRMGMPSAPPAARLARLAPGFAAGGLLLLLAVLAWQRSGVFHDGERLWRDTLAKNPNAILARYQLGVIRFNQGRPELALPLFESCFAEYPRFKEQIPAIADVHSALGNVEEAARFYRRSFAAGFADAGLFQRYAALLLNEGASREAGDVLDRGLAIHPGDCELAALKGLALEARGDAGAAGSWYATVLDADPGCQPAWQNLGLLRMHQGEWNEAVATLRTALRHAGGSYPIHHLNLGYAYLGGSGDAAAAVSEFKTYCRADPGCVGKLPPEFRDRVLGAAAPVPGAGGVERRK